MWAHVDLPSFFEYKGCMLVYFFDCFFIKNRSICHNLKSIELFPKVAFGFFNLGKTVKTALVRQLSIVRDRENVSVNVSKFQSENSAGRVYYSCFFVGPIYHSSTKYKPFRLKNLILLKRKPVLEAS